MRLCRLGVHRPGREMIWNAGHHFTRCADCGADLLRTASRWWRVPRRHVVAWKERTADDIFGDRCANPDRRAARRRLPLRWAQRPPY